MIGEYEIKKQICDIGKRIYQNGFVAANDGNVSVRISENEVLCTPTGISKGFMTPDMICKVDLDGKVLQANSKYKPSSEVKMHLRVYKLRPDVKSVVHAHPPYGTSFAIAGIPLNQPIMPEAVISLGCVPIAEYGTPSTDEIPDAVEKYLEYYDAVLLENHGALSYGDSLINAYYKMESLEFYAKLLAISMQIGGPKELSPNQVQVLYDLRSKYGLTGKHPGQKCSTLGAASCSINNEVSQPEQPKADAKDNISSIVEEVTRRVIEQLNK